MFSTVVPRLLMETLSISMSSDGSFSACCFILPHVYGTWETELALTKSVSSRSKPAPVAQLVEHSPDKREVVGSNPGLAHHHSCHSSEYVSIRPKRVNVRR